VSKGSGAAKAATGNKNAKGKYRQHLEKGKESTMTFRRETAGIMPRLPSEVAWKMFQNLCK
jgi:hypothetical protein